MPDELKAAIILFFTLLDEKQRRLYAGLEALKKGKQVSNAQMKVLPLTKQDVHPQWNYTLSPTQYGT